MSYIDDLTYRTLIDGYGTSFPVRKKLKFAGGTLIDDPRNDQTIIAVMSSGGLAPLDIVCNVGNAAYSQITHLYDPVDGLDAVNLRTLQAGLDALTLYEVLSNGNSTGGVHINLTNGSYLRSTDGYVGINSIVNMYGNRIYGVATPVAGSDAVNKDYVTNVIGAFTLAQVLTNGNVANRDIDMSDNSITDATDISFAETSTGPHITQVGINSASSAKNMIIQAQNNASGSGVGGDLIILPGYGGAGNGALKIQSPTSTPGVGTDHLTIDVAAYGTTIRCANQKLVAINNSGYGSSAIVPMAYTQTSPYPRNDKYYGTFSLVGPSNTYSTSFSTVIHGKTPIVNTCIVGKMMLGWTNSGELVSGGAAIEFLVSVTIDGYGDINQVYASLYGGNPIPPDPVIPNGFMVLNISTSGTGQSSIIPDMPTVALSHTDDTFTLTFQTPESDAGIVSQFYWQFEYGGIYS